MPRALRRRIVRYSTSLDTYHNIGKSHPLGCRAISSLGKTARWGCDIHCRRVRYPWYMIAATTVFHLAPQQERGQQLQRRHATSPHAERGGSTANKRRKANPPNRVKADGPLKHVSNLMDHATQRKVDQIGPFIERRTTNTRHRAIHMHQAATTKDRQTTLSVTVNRVLPSPCLLHSLGGQTGTPQRNITPTRYLIAKSAETVAHKQ